VTDVAFKFAGQVLDRGEDSAGDNIALDPGEPVFYLIEPGGVGRSVVEMDSGVSHKELLHPLGLVGRKVVGNEMNLFAARLCWRPLRRGRATNSWLVCRVAVLPTTSPLRVLSAAYSERVP
jgi:hypothetical protein